MGLSKTGTTSLQVFLHRNADALAAAGIHYPYIWADIADHPSLEPTVLRPYAGREANHLALALEIRKHGRDATEADANTPLWSNAFRLIEQSGAHTAIISYENFYVRPDLYRFDLLASRLRGFEVIGLIYLRRQEDWATSLYSQSIRGTARLAIPFAKFAAGRRDHLLYSVLLDAVLEHVPLNKLVVGNYDVAATSGLLRDFLEKANLPRDLLRFEQEQNGRNGSLPPWATLFLLRCNQAGLADEAFVDLSKALARVVSQQQNLPLRAGLDVATPEERQGLRDIAAADAARLEEKYGVMLSPALRVPPAYRPFDDDDFSAVKNLILNQISPSTREAIEDLRSVAKASMTKRSPRAR